MKALERARRKQFVLTALFEYEGETYAERLTTYDVLDQSRRDVDEAMVLDLAAHWIGFHVDPFNRRLSCSSDGISLIDWKVMEAIP